MARLPRDLRGDGLGDALACVALAHAPRSMTHRPPLATRFTVLAALSDV